MTTRTVELLMDVDGMPLINELFQLANEVRAGGRVAAERIAGTFGRWVGTGVATADNP